MVIAYRMPSNILHMYWPHIMYVLAFSYKRGRYISKSQFRDEVPVKANQKKAFFGFEMNHTAIPYRASTGPEQGFPCEVFHTGKNLFS